MSKYPGRIVSNLAPAGYSVYFDGTGDYLTWSGSTVGTGAFTFECWFYYTGTFSGIAAFVGPGTAVTNALNLYVNNSTQLTFDQYGVTATSFTVPTMVANQWYHVAFVRNAGGSATVFLNGVRSSTGAVSITTNYASIGAIGYVSSAVPRPWIGYLSNVRYTTAAVYDPTATTINVPTQLFNVTNTQLLTCNSPALVDQSTNNFTITANGNAAVSTLTPFTAYVPYNPALGASTPGIWTVDEAMQAAATRQWNMYDPSFNLTTLLLHGNGTNGAQNNTFLDSSTNNFTITRNGNTTQGSFSPFSQTGWSNYFDGSGNGFINVLDAGSVLDLPGDFTLEFWSYQNALATINGTLNVMVSVNTLDLFQIYQDASSFIFIINSATVISTATRPAFNVWNHLALVRSGTTITFYLNGLAVATGSSSFSMTCTSMTIGGQNRTGATSPSSVYHGYNGYMSNFRLVKGTAVYTTNFTPSTTPLTAISGTSLLTCQSNRFVDASSNALSISPVGSTAAVQAFSPFYPTAAYTPQTIGGSGFFDGTGDYLSVASNTALTFGTGDFTVEGWFYANALGGQPTILNNGSDAAGLVITTVSSKIYAYFVGAGNVFGSGGATIVTNTWYHFAWVRSGSTHTFYLNGAVYGATYSSAGNHASTGGVGIGYSVAGTVFAAWNGYIADVRMVKGTAVYTGAFTPPIAPVTTSGPASSYSSTTNVNTTFTSTNTSLLTNFTNAGVVDSTAKNVLETVGNAQISTAVSRFGGSSMYFDGTGDYLISNSGTDLYAFGSGDFTIEMWVNFAVVGSSGVYTLYDSRPNGTQGAYASIALDRSTAKIYYYVSSAIRITGSVTIVANTWYHVAICRSGTSTRLFVNGTQDGSTWTDTTTYLNPANRPVIAASGSSIGTEATNGYIDELRVTKGFARYTGNFTPQTSQWQDQ